MFAIKSLALLVVCLAFSQRALGFRYMECRYKETGALPVHTHVDVCKDATDDHCEIERGSKVTYNMAFETTRPFRNATLRISKVNLANSYQVFDSADACTGTGLKCPSGEGDKQSMIKSLTFSKDFPTGLRTCRFELLDENENPILCHQFLALVQ